MFYVLMKKGYEKRDYGLIVELDCGLKGIVTMAEKQIKNPYDYNRTVTVHFLEFSELRTGIILHKEKIVTGTPAAETIERKLSWFIGTVKYEMYPKYKLDTEEGRERVEQLIQNKIKQLGYAPHYKKF